MIMTKLDQEHTDGHIGKKSGEAESCDMHWERDMERQWKTWKRVVAITSWLVDEKIV